jgi:hypothetical protein
MRCVSFTIGRTLLLIGACAGPRCLAAGENLISNPGFEVRRGSTAADWRLAEGAEGNTFEWVHREGAGDDVHSGDRALRMNAVRAPVPDYSMDATSCPFRTPPHSRVEASVWLKASEVVGPGGTNWYGLRVTLTARDAFGAKIEHRDVMNERGSFGWRKIQGGMIVPQGTTTMDLSIKMTTCTGTVWIDDAEVRVAEELPDVNLAGVPNPVLIPRPWQSHLHGDSFAPGRVSIVAVREDPRVREAVDSYFTSIGVAHEFAASDDLVPGRYTQLIVGNARNAVLAREFSLRFPDFTWGDLEEQGYFLAVVTGERPHRIYLGANSPVGRFYALQTLKQLVKNRCVYAADILDRPTVACRGIPMGVQWFEQRNGEALQRLTQLKFNFVWVQGTFLDNYLDTDNWRLDFRDSQKTILREFIELYRKNFIDVWIALGPRGKNPPLQHSSERDINTAVRKMDVLYALGLRNFGLRFDDLGNVGENRLLVREDIKVFDDDIGAAQAYFIREVYSRLQALHPDIRFMVVPMDYSQTGNHGDRTSAGLRLQHFQELPAEIGIYAVSYYDEDVLAAVSLTGRPRVAVVSNFYSEGIEERSEYVVPFMNSIGWQNSVVRTKIAGFTWLPKIPQNEDAALISWCTTADFSWAPERYDSQRSFQSAAAKYLDGSGGTLP